jgi:hypothetical protein
MTLNSASQRMIRSARFALESRSSRRHRHQKVHFWNGPFTGHIEGIAGPTRMTRSRYLLLAESSQWRWFNAVVKPC